MLSQAEEYLLNYPAARKGFERALQLAGRRDKKDLKRLALLQEAEKKWAGLGISPGQLNELGGFLERELAASPCDHTRRLTEQWLSAAGVKNIPRVLRSLGNQGGFCDCEVLANVVGL